MVFAVGSYWSLNLYFLQIMRYFLGPFLGEIKIIWLVDCVAPRRRETKATKFAELNSALKSFFVIRGPEHLLC